MNGKNFGVIIELSQWEPYNVDNNPVYHVLDHFDEMILTVVDDLNKFSLKAQDEKLKKLSEVQDRMRFHPETHKLFLYFEDVEQQVRHNDDVKQYTARNLLNSYENGAPECDFFALVAIKARYQFMNSYRCGLSKCLRKYLEEYVLENNNENIRYCVMDSLSIDDVYILLEANDPNALLRFSLNLQLRRCDFSCMVSLGDEKGFAVDRRKDLQKAVKLLEESTDGLVNIEIEKDSLQCARNCVEYIKHNMESFTDDNFIELESIASILNEKITEVLSSKDVEYNKIAWLLKCYNAVRVCGSLPVILQTHTIVGYKKKPIEELENLKCLDREIFLGMQVQTKSGANFMYFDEKFYDSHFAKEDLPLSIVLGRHDHSLRKQISIKKFMSWYMRHPKEIEEEYYSAIRHYSGHLLIKDEDKRNLNAMTDAEKETLGQQARMFQEDICLSNSWARDRYAYVAELLSTLRSYDDMFAEFPFLEGLINEIDRLHMQGCRKLFYAMTLHEFEDTRKFFDAFYETLEEIFSILNDKSSLHRNYSAMMIAKGLKIILKSLSALFNDRMVLDMSMYENTRPSLYATGAYGVLLKSYSDWIKIVRGLLMKVERNTARRDRLNFILVPVEEDVIHSYNLFPLLENKQCLVVYGTTFDKMLDITNALPMFVHEVGHYLGILGRETRVKTFLRMISYVYSVRLARELCYRSRSPISPAIVRTHTEKLSDSLYAYFEVYFEKMGFAHMYMDHAAGHCKKLFNDFLCEKLYSPELDAEKALVCDFVNLYGMLNCASLISKQSRFLESLSAAAATEKAVWLCKAHLKEAYADIIMIQMLEMDTVDYIRVLLTSFKNRNDQVEAVNIPKGATVEGSQDIKDAIRVLSAILPKEFPEIDDNIPIDEFVDKLLKKIHLALPSIIENVTHMISMPQNTHLDEVWELLREAINLMMDDWNDYTYDWLCCWRLSIPYLYKGAQEVRERLSALESEDRDRLKKIRRLYSDVLKTSDTIRQLTMLIQMKDGEDVDA